MCISFIFLICFQFIKCNLLLRFRRLYSNLLLVLKSTHSFFSDYCFKIPENSLKIANIQGHLIYPLCEKSKE